MRGFRRLSIDLKVLRVFPLLKELVQLPLLEKLVSLVLCQLVHLEEELRRQQSVLLLVESISAFVLSQLLERGLPVCILISVSIATAPISLVFGPRSETIRFFVAFFEQAQVDV